MCGFSYYRHAKNLMAGDGHSDESSDEVQRLRRTDLNTINSNPQRSKAHAWASFVPLLIKFHNLV